MTDQDWTSPTGPLARLALVGAALGVVVGLAACTPESAGSPSAAPTAAGASPTGGSRDQQERAKVLALYNAFNEDLVKLQATSDVEAARTRLRAYTVDPLQAELILDLRQRHDAGLHTTGRPVWNARVTRLDLAGTPVVATVESCYDATNYALVNANGTPAGVSGQAKKYVVTATAELYGDGHWYFQTSQADRGRTC